MAGNLKGKTMAKTGLVVSAHPGDFVWRAGGAIALHAKKGYRVKIVCLAFGERGESHSSRGAGTGRVSAIDAHRTFDQVRPAGENLIQFGNLVGEDAFLRSVDRGRTKWSAQRAIHVGGQRDRGLAEVGMQPAEIEVGSVRQALSTQSNRLAVAIENLRAHRHQHPRAAVGARAAADGDDDVAAAVV